MLRPDLLVFGYFIFSVNEEDITLASDILLKSGIGASFDKKGRFAVSYRKRGEVFALFEGKVDFTVSAPKGFYGFLLKHKKRFGIMIGLVFVTFLFLLSSDTVWDVRIEGAADTEAEKIRAELSEAGLSVGKRWSKIDKNQIEVDMLALSDSVAWLNINRRGTVAYVKVSDKTVYPDEEKPLGYANIVAARDCVIEEIRVESGYAMVKRGESVQAGEVLISGVIPTELGGGFCYASGEVVGRYNDSVSVTVMRKSTEKEYNERSLSGYKIKIFGININIFKTTRQPSGQCDIIEEKNELYIGKRLPVSINKTYFQEYETVETELTESELVSLASEKLREELLIFLSDKEARRLVTGGESTSEGYKMVCDAIVSSDVTKIQEFKVE